MRTPKMNITTIGGFIVVAGLVIAAVFFLKKKGISLGADASLSDNMTGGGNCPAGTSGLDDLVANSSGDISADQITQFCASAPDDCGCTSL